ncbi:CrcB protein [Mesonia hippocampi]|uniref:Fluoride-specific ion channel FluC n=1 Tax=Mesonia hippocampi TaxID=1628250 RepID=A0A840EFP4_9FLAO|nr:fluoride efflux transporter CrcB [Mesonia hippocampi]MBB4118032.1 CrcB protein [Mesonia hippocampi]
MKQLLLVFIGGGSGSVLRYLLGKWLNNIETGIPYGTFLANISGSFFIGIILGLAAKNQSLSPHSTLLLASGFCGGFTTFSTFVYENHVFLKAGDYLHFFIYLSLSIIIGFIAVFSAMYLVKQI